MRTAKDSNQHCHHPRQEDLNKREEELHACEPEEPVWEGAGLALPEVGPEGGVEPPVEPPPPPVVEAGGEGEE